MAGDYDQLLAHRRSHRFAGAVDVAAATRLQLLLQPGKLIGVYTAGREPAWVRRVQHDQRHRPGIDRVVGSPVLPVSLREAMAGRPGARSGIEVLLDPFLAAQRPPIPVRAHTLARHLGVFQEDSGRRRGQSLRVPANIV